MTLNEFEIYVQEKCATPIECSVLGLAGEAGEVVDLIKKIEFHGHTKDTEKVLTEIGDALFYLSDIAVRYCNSNLGQAMELVKAKLDKRYKGAFTKEESVNRK